MSETFTAAVLCTVGAEKVVANELRKLGLEVMAGVYGRVRFGAGLDGLYRSLMSLRAADRVLLELARFPARDFDALFEGCGVSHGKIMCPGALASWSPRCAPAPPS